MERRTAVVLVVEEFFFFIWLFLTLHYAIVLDGTDCIAYQAYFIAAETWMLISFVMTTLLGVLVIRELRKL